MSGVLSFSPIKNRIIIGGNFGTIDNIAKTFRPYGKIQEISLHGQAKPYAFVTFVRQEAAEAALQHECNEIQISAANLEQRPGRNDRDVGDEIADLKKWEDLMKLAHSSAAAMQVTDTKLQHAIDIIKSELGQNQVAGVLDDTSDTGDTSILFLPGSEEMRKVSDSVPGCLAFPSLSLVVRGTVMDVSYQSWKLIQENGVNPQSLRLQVYPPSLKDALISSMEEFRPYDSNGISFSNTSKGSTHVVSVVQFTPRGEDNGGGVFKIGLSPAYESS